jgi:Fe-S cluster assembly ATPase SufC
MGSNGAGKSTFGHAYLPKSIKDKYTIFDGDKLSLLKKRELFKVVTPSLKEAAV